MSAAQVSFWLGGASVCGATVAAQVSAAQMSRRKCRRRKCHFGWAAQVSAAQLSRRKCRRRKCHITMKNDHKKRETIKKFEAIKEKLKEKIKYKSKDYGKIERKIAKLLGANRQLIQKWKNELNLNKNKIKKRIYEQKKRKFIEQFDEFKDLYAHGKQKEFVKELGISEDTFRKWKKVDEDEAIF